jgi:hypothetical protein
MLNTKPASRRPDRTASTCSRDLNGCSCNSASGCFCRNRRNDLEPRRARILPQQTQLATYQLCQMPNARPDPSRPGLAAGCAANRPKTVFPPRLVLLHAKAGRTEQNRSPSPSLGSGEKVLVGRCLAELQRARSVPPLRRLQNTEGVSVPLQYLLSINLIIKMSWTYRQGLFDNVGLSDQMEDRLRTPDVRLHAR